MGIVLTEDVWKTWTPASAQSERFRLRLETWKFNWIQLSSLSRMDSGRVSSSFSDNHYLTLINQWRCFLLFHSGTQYVFYLIGTVLSCLMGSTAYGWVRRDTSHVVLIVTVAICLPLAIGLFIAARKLVPASQVDDYELRIRLCTTVHISNTLRITVVFVRNSYFGSQWIEYEYGMSDHVLIHIMDVHVGQSCLYVRDKCLIALLSIVDTTICLPLAIGLSSTAETLIPAPQVDDYESIVHEGERSYS